MWFRISWRNTVLIALLWFGMWLFLNGLLFVHRTTKSDLCTDDRSRSILHTLCKEYRQGTVTGDLCQDLCVTGRLQYKSCSYYDSGKIVLKADWHGLPVVLKSKLENFSSYQSFHYLDGPDLSVDDLVLYATLQMSSSLGIEVKDSSVPGLSGGHGAASWAQQASLWTLLQQEEYVLLWVLQDYSQHVTKVLGSCGHFYAVEHLLTSQGSSQQPFPLEELLGVRGRGQEAEEELRALRRDTEVQIALGFLDMLHHFDHDFNHPLHLCDIKLENFGVRKDLTVVAIDVDMAFFEPKMELILEQNCTSDTDCNFFDCISKCDMEKSRCGSKRINSNLQVICNKVFRHWFSATLLGREQECPLVVVLQNVVQECADMAGGEDIRKHLLTLLTQLRQTSLESDRR